MSKHTPGPWETDAAEHDSPYQNILVMHGQHRAVCTVWIDDAPVQDFNAEQRANARLIAAAPDLLAFAQEFLADYQSDDGMASMKKYAGMAYAAIAKATGKSQ